MSSLHICKGLKKISYDNISLQSCIQGEPVGVYQEVFYVKKISYEKMSSESSMQGEYVGGLGPLGKLLCQEDLTKVQTLL